MTAAGLAHPDSARSADAMFAFPGLSELFVGVMAGALDSAGIVDEDAPLSTYLPSLGSLAYRRQDDGNSDPGGHPTG